MMKQKIMKFDIWMGGKHDVLMLNHKRDLLDNWMDGWKRDLGSKN